MSLLQRKPRPLKRDSGSLRDDRLFIVACDDTYAPDQYFNFFRLPRVQVKVIPTEDNTSHAEHVLNRLKQFDHDDDDELWMLLDTDHCTSGAHLKNFNNALRDAKNAGVRVALSKPCFELWLLLHHIDEENVTTINNAKQTESALIWQPGTTPFHSKTPAACICCGKPSWPRHCHRNFLPNYKILFSIKARPCRATSVWQDNCR